MPQKVRQLKADLRKIGAYQVSQEGSHTKWKHPLVPATTLVLSGHDGDDAKPYQEKLSAVGCNKLRKLAKRRDEICINLFCIIQY